MRSIRPSVEYILLTPCRRCNDGGMELTTHLHTVSKIRICGAIPPVPMFFSAVVLGESRDGFISCKARNF